ncbi:SigE family RNA polymerase sigma factor [Actinomadura rudentiformis]|uniref:SigE family RNA polymerase sigma factor n=1 Tax=Actinomadura rudentiformis TaxID=359158 RepID=A0A6H9YBQ1_9ACTN|nr:SigE family RNA polymerase sigma factor [Actinomadura rudentiformis]KAB2342718.1 SigE family RNA polymerase sigma factor [Actinomadura rudentiformis]
MADRSDYPEFVASRGEGLLLTAYLLTRNWATAEDLLQEALVKAWRAWPRLAESPDAYVRKVVVNTYISWWRRWGGEDPSADLPERVDGPDEYRSYDDRDAIWQAVGRLPRRQRAVLVLRYYEELTIGEVAEILGCTEGTVKSQTSKALTKLRADESIVPLPVIEGA